jgi:poly-gamma-glutamate synthesis protein (capsule biosynthesis protein)
MDNNIMKISFVGDLSATGIFHKKIENHQEVFMPELAEHLANSDFVVCNLEGAVTDGYPNIQVKNPANTIKYLTDRNFKVFNLANNHIFDCGVEGFNHTKNKITEHYGQYFGAGDNLNEASNIIYVKNAAVSVALIAVCDHSESIAGKNSIGVFSNKKLSLIKEKIREAKRNADFVILNYHGGEEYALYPSPEKKAYFKKISRIQELDIIIGHHSHTFQGFESINNKTIFYSLGNFIFDLDNHKLYKHVNESAILNITFSKSNYKFEFTPIGINTTKGLVEMNNSDFIQHIHSISSFDNYFRNWIMDAYRVIFERNTVENSFNSQSLLRDKTVSQAMFSLMLYKRIAEIFKDNNQRSIYIGAVLYKCCHFFFTSGKKSISLKNGEGLT